MESFRSRPLDATLTVTRAADVLGVHANTVRAWSDAGRLRYYRINPRGDRRYRLSDLQRFLAGLDASVAPAPYGAPPLSASLDEPRPTFAARRRPGTPSDEATVPLERHQAVLALAAELSALSGSAIRDALTNPGRPLADALVAIREALDAAHVSAWRLDDARLAPVSVAGSAGRGLVALPRNFGLLGAALDDPSGLIEVDPANQLSATSLAGREIACAIAGDVGSWGVLLVVRPEADPITDVERELLRVATTALGNIIRAASSATDVAHRLQRADALRRVAGDIGSRLDLDEILNRLVDHAAVLFAADRVAAFLLEGDGGSRMAASRGLSHTWVHAVPELHGTHLRHTV